MTEISTLIKQACEQLLNAKRITDILIGTVQIKEEEPIKIRVNQKLLLHKSSLIFSKNAANVVNGDTVILIRKTGGQIYFVIDKVADKI